MAEKTGSTAAAAVHRARGQDQKSRLLRRIPCYPTREHRRRARQGGSPSPWQPGRAWAARRSCPSGPRRSEGHGLEHTPVDHHRCHRRTVGEHGDHHVGRPYGVLGSLGGGGAGLHQRRCGRFRLRFQTDVGKPASTKSRAMADPMTPRPITATRVAELTGRTSRAASAPARCRTGTWGSSTARCGSCRPGS